MSQKKSAAEYSTQFQQYAARTDWDDNALMDMYQRGLKFNVKEELMRTGAMTESLEQLMAVVIELDDKLYELSMEKRRGGGQPNFGQSSYYPSAQRRYGKPQRDPYGHTPMELDFTQKQKKGKGGRKQQKGGKKAVNCYGCGKPGHFARDCKSTNMVRRPQLNIMEKAAIPKDRLLQDPEDPRITITVEKFTTILVEAGVGQSQAQEEASKAWRQSQAVERVEYPAEVLGISNKTTKEYLEDKQKVLENAGHVFEEISDILKGEISRWEEMYQGKMATFKDEIARKEAELNESQDQLAKIQAQIEELDNESENDGQACQEQDGQGQETLEGSEEENFLSSDSESIEEIPDEPQSCTSTLEGSQPNPRGPYETFDNFKDYRYDPCHPGHAAAPWNKCPMEKCHYHKILRREAGGKPCIPQCKKKYWNACQQLDCPWHLVEKRIRSTFPGYSKRYNEVLRRELKHNSDTIECHLIEWYACLHDKCQKHMRQKRLCGFLPKQGKE